MWLISEEIVSKPVQSDAADGCSCHACGAGVPCATTYARLTDRTDHELNRLIREHEATAVIHTGDFGFMNADSLDRMGDK